MSESERFSLRRWSRRKLDARKEAGGSNVPGSQVQPAATPEVSGAVAAASAAPPAAAITANQPLSTAASTAQRTDAANAGRPADRTGIDHDAASPLPDIESMTIDSDFSVFMRPGVDDALRRGALKKLFTDPRFNVMDGLDVYIGDYSKPDPIDPAVVRTLMQARYIFNPPPTRVTAEGYVEDVPEDPASAANAEQTETAPDAPAGDAVSTGRALRASCGTTDGVPAPSPVPEASATPASALQPDAADFALKST